MNQPDLQKDLEKLQAIQGKLLWTLKEYWRVNNTALGGLIGDVEKIVGSSYATWKELPSTPPPKQPRIVLSKEGYCQDIEQQQL